MTKHRYLVVLLMFLSVFVNYMDRVNFNVSIPAIRGAFGFSLEQIGAISFAWGIIYAVFNFPGGLLVDRLGLRKALPLLLGWWSIFTIALSTRLENGVARETLSGTAGPSMAFPRHDPARFGFGQGFLASKFAITGLIPPAGVFVVISAAVGTHARLLSAPVSRVPS